MNLTTGIWAMDTTTRMMVEEMGMDLAPGTSRRGVCPVCDGGSSKEHSFLVTATDDGGLRYRCYRVSCGVAGYLGGISTPVPPDQRKAPERRLIPYEGELTNIPYPVLNHIWRTYGIPPFETGAGGWRWAPEEERVAMPVYGPEGEIRGYQLRSYKGDNPKVLAYPMEDAPWQSFYEAFEGRPRTPVKERMGPLIVVEDQVSALKVARRFDSVALLGTNLSLDRMMEIETVLNGDRPLLFALDPDARSKAFDFVRQHGMMLPVTGTILLDKDPKDATDEEIRKAVMEAL